MVLIAKYPLVHCGHFIGHMTALDPVSSYVSPCSHEYLKYYFSENIEKSKERGLMVKLRHGSGLVEDTI